VSRLKLTDFSQNFAPTLGIFARLPKSSVVTPIFTRFSQEKTAFRKENRFHQRSRITHRETVSRRFLFVELLSFGFLFFFEKKKQKTFIQKILPYILRRTRPPAHSYRYAPPHSGEPADVSPFS